jgi:hypothetical protein
MIQIELMLTAANQGFRKEPVNSMMTRKLTPISSRKWNNQGMIFPSGEKHLQKQAKALMIKL